MSTLHFEIPTTLYLSQNDRLHFRKKAERTQALRLLARAVASCHDRVPTPCRMTVDVGWPDKRRRDRSNAASTIKALLDGVVEAGVLADDSDEHIVSETYTSHVEGNKGRIHLDITFDPIQENA